MKRYRWDDLDLPVKDSAEDKLIAALEEISRGTDQQGNRIPRDGLMNIARRALREVQ